MTLSSPTASHRSDAGAYVIDPAHWVSLFADSPYARTLEDETGCMVAANAAFLRICPLDLAELLGRELTQIPGLVLAVPPPSGDLLEAPAVATVVCQAPRIRYVLGANSESPKYFDRICETFPIASGLRYTLALWLDVTDQAQAEMHLQRRVQRAFSLFDRIPVGLVLSDAMEKTVRVNSTMQAMLGSALERFLAESPPPMSYEQRSGQSEHRIAATLDDGTTRWLDRYAGTVPSADGLPVVRITAAIDVTREVSLAAERVAQVTDRHHVHMREVHHRIKNNLQGIAGLIQCNGTRWPHLLQELEALSEQIYAVAEIYGLQDIETGTLSLQEAVKAIARNLSRVHGKPINVVGRDSDELSRWILSQREAMPCALALNELMTNAIKHSVGNAACVVTLSVDPVGFSVAITNSGTTQVELLAAASKASLSGIGLVHSLLPARCSVLSFDSRDSKVTATVHIRPPAVERR